MILKLITLRRESGKGSKEALQRKSIRHNRNIIELVLAFTELVMALIEETMKAKDFGTTLTLKSMV